MLALACSSYGGKSSSYPTAVSTTAPAGAVAPLATTAAATPASSATTGDAAATVKAGESALGKVLTDTKGMTLYTYNKDVAGSGQSAVSGGLLAAWPALTLASGTPAGGTGVAGALALITRGDGTKQVTYMGLPLYYWQADKAPGDVTGQGIAGFAVAIP
jgi:predicted lipoprotein with Yx(FWY)xxD motif